MIPRNVDELVLQAMAKDPAGRPPSMELFAEMLQTALASLPPDPNRSAGMSVQQGAVTPMAPSSFQAPIVAPPSGAAPFTPQFPPPNPPPGFAPPQTPPPPSQQHAGYAAPIAAAPTYPIAHQFAPSSGNTPAVAAKSKTPIWILLGLLALGGAGVGVWFAVRAPQNSTNGDQVDHRGSDDADESNQDPWEGPNDKDNDDDDPPAPQPPGEDPWAPKGASSPKNSKPAVRRTVGTAMTPIPAGGKLRVGRGFTSQITDKGHVHINAARGLLIALAPLDGGTNDPDELAQKWIAETGVTVTGSMKVFSAGKQRPALGFIGQVNGTPVNQIIVLYLEPDYRVGVLYQAPSDVFADESFQREVMGFFARSVVLP
jgi:hypothetical protein